MPIRFDNGMRGECDHNNGLVLGSPEWFQNKTCSCSSCRQYMSDSICRTRFEEMVNGKRAAEGLPAADIVPCPASGGCDNPVCKGYIARYNG